MVLQALRFTKQYIEPIIWTSALVLLFFMNTDAGGTSLCLAKAIGIGWCPGCGLGHAIHDALHLNFRASVQQHILGIPATILLGYQIIKSIYITRKNDNYGPTTTHPLVSRHGL